MTASPDKFPPSDKHNNTNGVAASAAAMNPGHPKEMPIRPRADRGLFDRRRTSNQSGRHSTPPAIAGSQEATPCTREFARGSALLHGLFEGSAESYVANPASTPRIAKDAGLLGHAEKVQEAGGGLRGIADLVTGPAGLAADTDAVPADAPEPVAHEKFAHRPTGIPVVYEPRAYVGWLVGDDRPGCHYSGRYFACGPALH